MNDLISRQAAIDAAIEAADEWDGGYSITRANMIADAINNIAPSAQPDIIQCRNCKFASGDSRICMKFGHSPIGELDFCTWAERRTDG